MQLFIFLRSSENPAVIFLSKFLVLIISFLIYGGVGAHLFSKNLFDNALRVHRKVELVILVFVRKRGMSQRNCIVCAVSICLTVRGDRKRPGEFRFLTHISGLILF